MLVCKWAICFSTHEQVRYLFVWINVLIFFKCIDFINILKTHFKRYGYIMALTIFKNLVIKIYVYQFKHSPNVYFSNGKYIHLFYIQFPELSHLLGNSSFTLLQSLRTNDELPFSMNLLTLDIWGKWYMQDSNFCN